LSAVDQEKKIADLAAKQADLDGAEAQLLLRDIRALFKRLMTRAGYSDSQIQTLVRKFTDSGRRSPPWQPASSIVPGRPQSGSDGNRRNRWLFDEDHKYYADEATATFVEIKYFLQTLSMVDAPEIDLPAVRTIFTPWLLEHDAEPGAYIEPILLTAVELKPFVENPTSLTSGHLVPLDRPGGRHVPSNTFLVYARSNQLQGNLTLEELLLLANELVQRHEANGTFPSSSKILTEDIIDLSKTREDS
jgi:hypothetical protein